MDDIVFNKVAAIERCIHRILEEYAGDEDNLFSNLTKQDSILLNLQRACETSIDLAMHLVRVRKLGIPQDSRDAFDLLVSAGLLDTRLADELKRMVGFRNVAVHAYQSVDLGIVKGILDHKLAQLGEFARWALTL